MGSEPDVSHLDSTQVSALCIVHPSSLPPRSLLAPSSLPPSLSPRYRWSSSRSSALCWTQRTGCWALAPRRPATSTPTLQLASSTGPSVCSCLTPVAGCSCSSVPERRSPSQGCSPTRAAATPCTGPRNWRRRAAGGCCGPPRGSSITSWGSPQNRCGQAAAAMT